MGFLKPFVGFTFVEKESLCGDPETFVGFTFVEKESLCRDPETFVEFTFIYLFEPKMVTSHCVFSNLI